MGKAVELLTEIRDLLAKQQGPLLSKQEVVRFLGFGKSSIDRAESAGQIPPAVSTPAGPRWRREDLLKWVTTLKPRRKKPRRRVVVPTEPPDSPGT